MNEDPKAMVQKMIDSIGALSEMAGILRDSLMQNGFTREESVGIACEFVISTIIHGGNNDES